MRLVFDCEGLGDHYVFEGLESAWEHSRGGELRISPEVFVIFSFFFKGLLH